MLAIIAPARNVRLPAPGPLPPTKALFGREAEALAARLREYSPWQLESLLDVPPERAFSLHDDYRRFSPNAPGSPALLTYYGAAYRNMRPQDFDPAELAFAQNHLRILSAFYGLLRPMDGIVNHRLGLKKDFTPGGQDLYTFWGDKLCRALYATGEVVVNLASVEYAKLIRPHMLPGQRMVTCRFLVERPGQTTATVATVRAARGLMARYIIENAIDVPEELKGFDLEGHSFAPARSTAAEYVFIKRRVAFP